MVQKKKSSSHEKETITPVESKKSETAEKTIEDADALIDKIDDLIKDINAEEFVNQYKQLGGQ